MKSTSSSGILGSFLRHVFRSGVAVSYCGRPVGRWTWIVTPFGVDRDSTRSSATSGPLSGNSRVPWPTTTGQTNRVISSTSWLSSSQRTRLPLPCTCSSPPGLAFSSAMAVARSSERTVVSAHRGSVRVVEARYLGRVFNAARICPCSPGAGKDLVGPPAEQERVGALVDLVQKRHGLVVERMGDPSAALESAPAVLVRPAESLHHAVDGDHRGGRELHARGSLLAGFVVVGSTGPPHRCHRLWHW